MYSHEVGYAKPDPRIFETLCRRVGRGPDEMVFIDDSATAVEAAAAFGIASVHHVDNASTIDQVERLLARSGQHDLTATPLSAGVNGSVEA